MDEIKIVMIDDHKIVREGIKQLLELEDNLCVIGQASDGYEGLRVIEDNKPDVVLLDINMPNFNGISLLTKLDRSINKCKIIVLTIHNEIEYLFKTLDLNVDGYVLKDSESSVLIEAINSVYNGNTYIQKELAPLLIDYRGNSNSDIDIQKIIKSLSEREIQVLSLLSRGFINKEIADELKISEKTVKNHTTNIFRKINVNDRTQAALFAVKYNIVDI